MRSKNILDEISDGKLYDIGDMVKADTGGCTGCSDCCKDVGDLVVLTPFDVNEIVNFLGVSFDELLGDKIVLRETNKISLPYLKMQDKNKYCSFLIFQVNQYLKKRVTEIALILKVFYTDRILLSFLLVLFDIIQYNKFLENCRKYFL